MVLTRDLATVSEKLGVYFSVVRSPEIGGPELLVWPHDIFGDRTLSALPSLVCFYPRDHTWSRMTAGAPAITSLFQAGEEKGRARDKGGFAEIPYQYFLLLSHWPRLAAREAGIVVVQIDALLSTTVKVSVLAEESGKGCC